MERDSATFGDKGTEVPSFSRDKGTTGQAQNPTMYRNGNFGLVFGRGEILLTYMIFVYHWTS